MIDEALDLVYSESLNKLDTEGLSELLELESRRYSRRLTEEDEARLR